MTDHKTDTNINANANANANLNLTPLPPTMPALPGLTTATTSALSNLNSLATSVPTTIADTAISATKKLSDIAGKDAKTFGIKTLKDDLKDVVVDIDHPDTAPSVSLSDKQNIDVTTEELRNKIIATKIRPTFEADLDNMISWRGRWAKISAVASALAELCMIATTIVAFAASKYNIDYLVFLGGCIGIVGSAMLRICAYSDQKSKKLTTDTNKIFATLGIHAKLPIPMQESGNDTGSNGGANTKIKSAGKTS